jgi:preprotein translocase subunit SecD
MKNTLALLLIFSITLSIQAKDSVVQFRLVDESVPSNEPAMKIRGTSKTVHLQKEIILTEKHIASIKYEKSSIGSFEVLPDGTPKETQVPDYPILIVLTPDGAAIMKKFSSANIGKSLAIVVNNMVIAMPKMVSEVSTSLQLTSNFTEEEVKEVVDVVNKAKS